MKLKMNSIAIIIVLILAGASLGGLKVASGEPLLLADEAVVFFDLINNVRQRPLEYAVSLGFDPENLLEELPDLKSVLIDGLPALKMNEKLRGASLAYIGDVLSNGDCANQSTDVAGSDEMIKEWGYFATVSAGVSRVLSFNNFLLPEDAINIIFQKMFIDELDPDRVERRNILGEDFDEVGVGVGAGVLCVDGVVEQNVYLVSCNFARSVNYEAIELELLRMINEARMNPRKAMIEFGFTNESIGDLLGDQQWALLKGLPPLAKDSNISEAASGHLKDMIQGLYFDSIDREGLGPFDRVTYSGYNAISVTEVLAAIESAKICTSRDIARNLYFELMRKELACRESFGRGILCSGITEVGIAVGSTYVNIGDNYVAGFCVAVLDFALPVKPRNFLLGNIYRDLNDNNKYEKSEGISGMVFSIKSLNGWDENWMSVISGPDGWWQLELEIIGGGLFEYKIMSQEEFLFSEGFYFGGFIDFHNNVLKDWKIE
ncbi:MAG: hypothetical protein JXL81_12115 [Deltaproteobacteria bacterium]|nr:hypothetical protein [Deltaproteobacteria bacterium]